MSSNQTKDKYGKIEYSNFLPYVLPYINDCPPQIAEHNIRLSCIEFLNHTRLVKVTSYIDTQENVGEYFIGEDIDLDCYCISSIGRVCLGGRELQRLDQDKCCPTDCGYIFNMPCDVFITPPPSEDMKKSLSVELFLQPTQDGCSVDRWIYEKYAETIAQGALYRIYNLTRQPWYDPSQAGLHARFYAEGMEKARCDRVSGFSSGVTKVKTRRWC